MNRKVDVYGDRFRSRANQLTPRLLLVARYINENREAVMEQTAMEIALPDGQEGGMIYGKDPVPHHAG